MPIDIVPVPSPDQLKKLEEDLARVESVIVKGDAALKKRQAFIEAYKALVKAAQDLREEGEDLARLIDELRFPKPRPPRALVIDSAWFGDFRHRHVCDATAFFLEKCKLNPDAEATATHCVVSGQQPDAFCGFNPSPQGEREIRISYRCGDQQRPELRLPGHAAVRLICDVPVAPAPKRVTTNAGKQESTPVQPPAPKQFEKKDKPGT